MKTYKQLVRELEEALMYQGKPSLPKTNKPETTIKTASTGGHKKFQSRAGRKIKQ